MRGKKEGEGGGGRDGSPRTGVRRKKKRTRASLVSNRKDGKKGGGGGDAGGYVYGSGGGKKKEEENGGGKSLRINVGEDVVDEITALLLWEEGDAALRKPREGGRGGSMRGKKKGAIVAKAEAEGGKKEAGVTLKWTTGREGRRGPFRSGLRGGRKKRRRISDGWAGGEGGVTGFPSALKIEGRGKGDRGNLYALRSARKRLSLRLWK